jgi:methyl-accepting chemotaxis protein
VTKILETRESLLWLLILMQVTFTFLVFLISIFMSHKIAGPLFQLKKLFSEVKNGNLTQRLAFRSKDYFQDLVPEFNGMMESLQSRIENTDNSAKGAILSLEKALEKVNPEARPELEISLNILNTSLKNRSNS